MTSRSVKNTLLPSGLVSNLQKVLLRKKKLVKKETNPRNNLLIPQNPLLLLLLLLLLTLMMVQSQFFWSPMVMGLIPLALLLLLKLLFLKTFTMSMYALLNRQFSFSLQLFFFLIFLDGYCVSFSLLIWVIDIFESFVDICNLLYLKMGSLGTNQSLAIL